jgi:hypothetical protein
MRKKIRFEKTIKYLKAQTTIEYILLVAISLLALIVGMNFIERVKGGPGMGLNQHFDTVRHHIVD